MSGTGLIGGGRWARVIASVLARVVTGPVSVASVSNPGAWQTRPKDWTAVDMAGMLRDPKVQRVIIARRANQHAETVLAALRAGKDVLVEKPFCLTRNEADAIIDAARGRVCQTGLVLLFASNQQRFRQACLSHGPITRLRIVWADPRNEIRGGEWKVHDRALNPAQDVLPHVWSIMRPYGSGPFELLDVDLLDDCRGVFLKFGGALSVDCTILRDQDSRSRRLEVTGPQLAASLDFTSEPGTAVVNGLSIDVATGHSSPLEAELRAFMAGVGTPLADVTKAVEALDLTLQVMGRLRQMQRTVIRLGCVTPSAAAVAALEEVALGGTAACGRGAGREEIVRWIGIDPTHAGFATLWTSAFPGS